ncbi:DMT family transporter [Xanthovirga aplysinae]|uniref:DMT family transporter n=1 Tax=Xanthovirga aplysinae TaxID=2529853 RepID=UPI0012BCFB96|nr:DMT family transporter [Xanthovirga aplysinae]MTI30404.1 EamA family transporter [Xanthovirga aplysinae]
MKNRGILLLHLAALLLGGSGLFSKLIEWPAATIIFSRSLLSFLLLAVTIFFFSRNSFKVHAVKDLLIILLSGILFGGHLLTYFSSIQASTVSIGIVALFTFPVITAFAETLFTKEKVRMKDVLTAFLVFTGVLIMVSEEGFTLENGMLAGIGLGLISAFFYAFRNLVQKYYLQKYSALSILCYQLLVTAFISIPFMEFEPLKISSNEIGLLFILSLVCTVIPHSLIIYSLKTVKAKTVSIILGLMVVYAMLLAHVILDEVITLPLVFGGLLVFSATLFESFYLNWNERKTKKVKVNT